MKDKELKELQELLVKEQGGAKGMSKTAAVCKDLQQYVDEANKTHLKVSISRLFSRKGQVQKNG